MSPTRRAFLGDVAGITAALAAGPRSVARFDGADDLGLATATDALQALRARKISALELTRAQLDRIRRLNPSLNAVIDTFTESALAQARAVDGSSRQAIGPLGGLPVTVKDTFEVEGFRTTAGFEPLRHHTSKRDAAAVARLRAAGAVILGHTNTPALASDWQSDNAIYGRTSNPWDRDRTPGGSSGGSAAAVAAGLGYLSLGSDIGGSIRIPAAWTGTYGHKPTVNVVPLRGHIPPMPGVLTPPPSLPVAGPMSRSADDLLLALRALGGPDEDEAVGYRWTLPSPRQQALRSFRVGFVLDHPACPVVPEVRAVLERAIAAIRSAGATVTEGWPEGVDPVAQYRTYLYLVSVAAFSGGVDETKIDEVRKVAARTGNGFEEMVARAQTDHPKRIAAREEERLGYRAAWQRWFRSHDVFLMPVVFTTAIKHQAPQAPIPSPGGSRDYLDLLWWIATATLTGCPATSAPIGRTSDGLPVGLQIVGPYLEDATPITFAARLADLVGGYTPPKGFA